MPERPLLVAVRPLGLGDLLTGVPALRALADAFPEHRRVLAAPAALAPLALRMGAVEEVVDTAALAPLDPSLHGADVLVNLHGRGPESHRVVLAARPRRLLAWEHAAVPESAGLPRWRAGEHEVARWCRLLAESGIPADPTRLGLEPPDIAVPAEARGATLIHPGAAFPSRRWPPERFAAVARAEREAGRTVFVTGSAAEIGLARRVARAAGLGDDAVLAGRTGLEKLAALVSAAGRLVCGDTGVAHLATAFGTPSVVLFGPVSPVLWGPPPSRRHLVLWAGTRGDPHGTEMDSGLLRIGVDDVVRALAELEPVEAAAAA